MRSGPAAIQLEVRPATGREELAQAAALRAEAYYEVGPLRQTFCMALFCGCPPPPPFYVSNKIPPPRLPESQDLVTVCRSSAKLPGAVLFW